MPDDRHIGHCADHGVAVDTLGTAPWAVALAIVEQGAEHHRDIAVDGGMASVIVTPSSTVRTIVSATTAAGNDVESGTGLPGR